MSKRGPKGLALAALVIALLSPLEVWAASRYAIIVSGASGDPKFADKYNAWRTALAGIFRTKFQMDREHLFVLAETASADVQAASRQQVKTLVERVARAATKDDMVVVVLIGHGTFDGGQAKFNLVGPDLDADEWSAMLAPIAGRLVMVNTTSSSFPFLEKLSRKNRVVITATDTAAQRYETVFPDYFVKALNDPSADLDKNGRVSLWEAFTHASAGVHQYYEERGQLATERALLDDNGDKVGKEAESPGPDGGLASATYFDAEIQSANGDAELADLLRRRDQFVGDIEVLKAKKGSMPKEQYDSELEKLLVDLAMLSRQIRTRGSS